MALIKGNQTFHTAKLFFLLDPVMLRVSVTSSALSHFTKVPVLLPKSG